MLFQECERLANEQPDLQQLLQNIDAKLQQFEPNSVLRIDLFASFFQVQQSKISGIFNKLVNYGLLREEEIEECKYCLTAFDKKEYYQAKNNKESYECQNCKRDLTIFKPKKTLIYRINAKSIHKRNTPLDITAIPTIEITNTGFDEPLPKEFLSTPFKNTPLLQYYSKDKNLISKKPFDGKRILFVLHFLRDLIPFIKAAECLGLNPQNTTLFYKQYPYPQKQAIIDWLQNTGFKMSPSSQISSYLSHLSQTPPERIGKILIAEDGGFFAPIIHREYPKLCQHVIGTVEQTTKGVRNTQDWVKKSSKNKIQFPILSVATSNLKNKFEPQYIAKAVLKNIENFLPNTSLRGKKIAILGYGTIGEEVANIARTNGAEVTIFECDDEKKMLAQTNGFSIADSPTQAAENKKIIIGASGEQSINSEVIANVSHDSYLLSTSSEQYEIDLKEIEQLSKVDAQQLKNEKGKIIGTDYVLRPDRRIHVLANGYPVNFWGLDSMPEEASDLIMSLILLSMAEVALGNYSKKEINSEAVNELSDKNHYDVAGKFMKMHKQG